MVHYVFVGNYSWLWQIFRKHNDCLQCATFSQMPQEHTANSWNSPTQHRSKIDGGALHFEPARHWQREREWEREKEKDSFDTMSRHCCRARSRSIACRDSIAAAAVAVARRFVARKCSSQLQKPIFWLSTFANGFFGSRTAAQPHKPKLTASEKEWEEQIKRTNGQRDYPEEC